VSNDFPAPDASRQPEYLEQGSGSPLTESAAGSTGRGKKAFLIGGAAVGGLALAGAGTWAAITLSGGGPQPSEALPDSTLGYVSIDLDPSASQKIEALKMLKKFPSFAEEVDLDTKDDLRRRLFEEIQKDASCDDLDYDKDIEPWLGDRAAFAAVDVGDGEPIFTLAVQVTDDEAADGGLTKISECGAASGSSDEAGWVIADGWALLSDTEEHAKSVADAAADGTLAEDETFQKWTEEVGDPGIMTMYAAPAAAEQLMESLENADSMFGQGGEGSVLLTDDMRKAMAEFGGMAGTLRFNDGAVELEMAADTAEKALLGLTEGAGGDLVASLPEGTLAAVGMSFPEDWFATQVEAMTKFAGAGEDVSADDLMAELSTQTGLDLPQDVDTLMGSAMTVSLGADFDLEEFTNSSDLSGLPLAAKVKGDPKAIEKVLDKLRAQMGGEGGTILGTDIDGDVIVIGPNRTYRSDLADGGTLGDSATYRDVVREADQATGVVYVDFDANDWLVELSKDDDEVARNLEPLSAFGMSTWISGDAGHTLLRLTTD
jgi:Protein of unknown function (DUF3352)